jgi:hypothetical protein
VLTICRTDAHAAALLWQLCAADVRQTLILATVYGAPTNRLRRLISSNRYRTLATRAYTQLPQYVRHALTVQYDSAAYAWSLLSTFDALELLRAVLAVDDNPSTLYLVHHAHDVRLCTYSFAALPIRVQALLCIAHVPPQDFHPFARANMSPDTGESP